jgi:hypothetical protein
MRTSFLLAASIAGVFALAGIDRSAEAQMLMETQPSAKSPTAKPKAAKTGQRRSAAAPKRKTAGRGFLPRAGGKGPGQCGPMMYWKGGRCVDARATKK